ncbi:MAG: phage tail assembly chaperone [Proteobacteria bacterium]|nr:phage tail assembly chaperone [Pseudomonadota bacterium]
MKPPPFPWSEALGFALARLHLSPEAFWAMTPRELAAAIRFVGGGEAPSLDRQQLQALIEAFPDTKEPLDNGHD